MYVETNRNIRGKYIQKLLQTVGGNDIHKVLQMIYCKHIQNH